MTGAAEPGIRGDAKHGLLHMLKQPSRGTADAQDGAGRGTASAALRTDASKPRVGGAGASQPQAAAAPGDGAKDAPASGAKVFLEAAKRALDKAEYVQVRAVPRLRSRMQRRDTRRACSSKRCSRRSRRRR